MCVLAGSVHGPPRTHFHFPLGEGAVGLCFALLKPSGWLAREPPRFEVHRPFAGVCEPPDCVGCVSRAQGPLSHAMWMWLLGPQ